jgi:hypothetical protein
VIGTITVVVIIGGIVAKVGVIIIIIRIGVVAVVGIVIVAARVVVVVVVATVVSVLVVLVMVMTTPWVVSTSVILIIAMLRVGVATAQRVEPILLGVFWFVALHLKMLRGRVIGRKKGLEAYEIHSKKKEIDKKTSRICIQSARSEKRAEKNENHNNLSYSKMKIQAGKMKEGKNERQPLHESTQAIEKG